MNHSSKVQRRVYCTRLGYSLAAIAAVMLIFYAVLGYVSSAGMFGDHPRWRGMNRGPADFGLRSETVAFDSTDGIPLKAWWLPASGTPRGVVIIAHGIDHTRQVMLPRAGFFVRGGYDVLAIDLRGHGESGGSITSPGLLEARDILGALRFIRSRGNQEPVALLGVSYGAVASLIAAAESPEIAAVISDSAFLTGKDVSEDINRHYLHDPRTNFWVRALFLVSSTPGAARATALIYYLRSGIDPADGVEVEFGIWAAREEEKLHHFPLHVDELVQLHLLIIREARSLRDRINGAEGDG